MKAAREEAAPSFAMWRQRLKAKEQRLRLLSLLSLLLPSARQRLKEQRQELQEDVARFLEVLRAIGTPMIDEPLAHFIYYGPQAQRVFLVGEFTQWVLHPLPLSPLGRTGLFYRTVEFRSATRMEYKLVVDGQWRLDPLCPHTIDNGLGDQNAVFVVGDVREPPELAWVPEQPHGRVEEFDFDSQLLHNRRRVYVYLPPGYDADVSSRYPTLYVHDGGEYLHRARLSTVLDNLLRHQEIPALLAVMVDPVDRRHEYWANEDYARFVEHELLPHIDQHYRTRTEREARGVMGASLGGLISLYLALSRPHLFAKVGGQSSAFFLEEDHLTTLVQDLQVPLTCSFDVGQYEPRFIPAHQRLVPRLEARGCRCVYQELAGGHNWTSWRAHLKDVLIFLWRGLPAGTARD